MKLLGGVIGLFAASVLAAAQPAAKETEMKVYTDPEHADADFKFQGEYASASAKLGAQVRALGHGAFRTMFFAGGLPGDGWDGKTIIQKSPSTDTTTPADARLDSDKVVIEQVYQAVCDGRTLTGIVLNEVNAVTAPVIGGQEDLLHKGLIG